MLSLSIPFLQSILYVSANHMWFDIVQFRYLTIHLIGLSYILSHCRQHTNTINQENMETFYSLKIEIPPYRSSLSLHSLPCRPNGHFPTHNVDQQILSSLRYNLRVFHIYRLASS